MEVKEVEAQLSKIEKATGKDNQGYKDAKAFLKLLKAVSDKERKQFNKNIADVINKAAVYAKASTTLDQHVKALGKQVANDDKASEDLKTTMLAAMKPVEHRETLRKVSGALSSLAEKSNKINSSKLNEGGDKPDDGDKKGDKPEEGGSAAGIIIGVLAAAIAVGGVSYCYCKKKMCFAEKEEANEGGETDKTVYKQEVKSKNSHKRHAKESLMPAFQVAEEQAWNEAVNKKWEGFYLKRS